MNPPKNLTNFPLGVIYKAIMTNNYQMCNNILCLIAPQDQRASRYSEWSLKSLPRTTCGGKPSPACLTSRACSKTPPETWSRRSSVSGDGSHSTWHSTRATESSSFNFCYVVPCSLLFISVSSALCSRVVSKHF